MNLEMVTVIWHDAYDNPGYVDPTALAPYLTVISTGMLLDENPERIVVAMDYNPQAGIWSNSCTIPRAYIHRIIRLGSFSITDSMDLQKVKAPKK